jgi:hypothetical protein
MGGNASEVQIRYVSLPREKRSALLHHLRRKWIIWLEIQTVHYQKIPILDLQNPQAYIPVDIERRRSWAICYRALWTCSSSKR